MSQAYLVITSWPDLDGARRQARNWVEKKLAASVNILPQMDSIYRWQGEIRSGREHKIFIKTSAQRLDVTTTVLGASAPEIPNVEPDTEYTVLVRRGLAAKNGLRLKAHDARRKACQHGGGIASRAAHIEHRLARLDVCKLDQQPGRDQVSDGNPKNIPSFQLTKQVHGFF